MITKDLTMLYTVRPVQPEKNELPPKPPIRNRF
jgi:hypothetical protein